MICMWFTGINCYKLAVEKDRDFIFTTGHMEIKLKLFISHVFHASSCT